MYECMYICISTHIHICIYIYIHTCAYIYIHIHIHVHVYMYTCMYDLKFVCLEPPHEELGLHLQDVADGVAEAAHLFNS